MIKKTQFDNEKTPPTNFLIMSLIGVQSIDTDNLKCVSCEALIDLVRPHGRTSNAVVDVSIPACIVRTENLVQSNSSEGPWACKDLCIGMMNEKCSTR